MFIILYVKNVDKGILGKICKNINGDFLPEPVSTRCASSIGLLKYYTKHLRVISYTVVHWTHSVYFLSTRVECSLGIPVLYLFRYGGTGNKDGCRDTRICRYIHSSLSHTHISELLKRWGLHTRFCTAQPTLASCWRHCRLRGPLQSCARSSWPPTHEIQNMSFSFYFKAGFKYISQLKGSEHGNIFYVIAL